MESKHIFILICCISSFFAFGACNIPNLNYTGNSITFHYWQGDTTIIPDLCDTFCDTTTIKNNYFPLRTILIDKDQFQRIHKILYQLQNISGKMLKNLKIEVLEYYNSSEGNDSIHYYFINDKQARILNDSLKSISNYPLNYYNFYYKNIASPN